MITHSDIAIGAVVYLISLSINVTRLRQMTAVGMVLDIPNVVVMMGVPGINTVTALVAINGMRKRARNQL